MARSDLDKVEAARQILARRRARASFAGFCEYAQPAEEQPVAHHRLMIAAFQSVLNGETDRLLVQMPPGSAKSAYGSVLLPAYFLGQNPQLNVIAASHTLILAERFGRRTRNLLAEDRIKALWQSRVASDSSAAGRWATSVGGEYLAAGVGGAITGFRADLAVVDDPVKSRDEADSDIVRERTWEWWVNDLRTRLKPGARVVVIMTRWHEDDLAGRLLDKEPERWRVLKLKMEAGEGDPLGRAPGERLWAEWFTEKMVEEAKSDPRAWSSLYQQEPRPREGAEFKRSWINRYDEPPRQVNRIILVDPASGEEGQKRTRKGNDFTSIWVLGLGADENVYGLDLIRARLNLSERMDALFELHRKWKPHQTRYERVGMQADVQALKMEMNRRDYRFKVTELHPQVAKEARIRRLIYWFEAGRIWLPRAIEKVRDGKRVDVLAEFIDEEYASFPLGVHDDAFDALAQLAEPKLTLPWPKEEMQILIPEPWKALDPLVAY